MYLCDIRPQRSSTSKFLSFLCFSPVLRYLCPRSPFPACSVPSPPSRCLSPSCQTSPRSSLFPPSLCPRLSDSSGLSELLEHEILIFALEILLFFYVVRFLLCDFLSSVMFFFFFFSLFSTHFVLCPHPLQAYASLFLNVKMFLLVCVLFMLFSSPLFSIRVECFC